MALVTSSRFSILVNGSPLEIFIPSRGLRQGDPLSPFLFILMMEGLGRSIKHAKAMGKIEGLQLSENGQALTHQQFVDDTMLQGLPTVKEISTYNQILKEFALATEDFVSLKQETDHQGLHKVKDFWDLAQTSGKWRSWRKLEYRDDSPIKIKVEALGSLLKQRMILVTEGQDQLRWGNNNKGNFNLKEAKSILLGLDYRVPNKTWQLLWKHQGWMKIKLFMWLVHHKKILTWDNIRKRGVMGPSKCHLCEVKEENMEHILNSCSYTTWLWDSFSSIFQ
eukprot:PITA_12671